MSLTDVVLSATGLPVANDVKLTIELEQVRS